MRLEIVPQFEGRNVRQIYLLWEARERAAFNKIAENLQERVGATAREEDTRPKAQVIPFAAGNESNGATSQASRRKTVR